MRLSHIIEATYARPWAITPSGWETVHRLVSSKLAGEIMTPVRRSDDDPDTDDEDLFGDKLPATSIANGVSLIPVQGVIGRKIGLIGKRCGGCDLLDVEKDLVAAMANPDVHTVLFDIDSPGGSVTGVPEAATKIHEARGKGKGIYAFTDGMMCSAAYWLASQCETIYATPSADVGSIGVYMALLDQSRAFEMQGLKTDLFKAGRLKAMGVPGTVLTDEQRELLQSEVDNLYAWFISDVKQGRNFEVDSEAMQGQSFNSAKAQSLHLIDTILPDLAAVLAAALTRRSTAAANHAIANAKPAPGPAYSI